MVNFMSKCNYGSDTRSIYKEDEKRIYIVTEHTRFERNETRLTKEGNNYHEFCYVYIGDHDPNKTWFH
jgi:hypothetical protein